MDQYLQQGILAAKAGDKARAFDLLMRATEVPATSEQAWLWLSGVVGDDAERLFCLDNALKVNPSSAAAQRGAAMLRQRGIFPAVPVYPESQRNPPTTGHRSQPAPVAQSAQPNFAAQAQPLAASAPVAVSAPQQESSSALDLKKQELGGYFQYAAMELANNRSQREVERLLVGRGASPEIARTVVRDAQYTIRKVKRDKHKKRMIRGLLWTIAGIIFTCGTYIFADQLGGSYYLCWGAIIFGFIDLVIGLIGWLANA